MTALIVRALLQRHGEVYSEIYKERVRFAGRMAAEEQAAELDATTEALIAYQARWCAARNAP